MNPLTIILIKQFVLGSSAMLALLILNNLLAATKQSSKNTGGVDHD